MRSSKRAALLALPAVLLLVVFSVVPLFTVFRYATWDWSGLAEPVYVGFSNFRRLLDDRVLRESLMITVLFWLMTLPSFLLLSTTIAVAIEGTRLERFLKAILFLPGLLTVGGSTVAWFLLYNPDFGLVVDVTGLALPWASEPWAALVYVVLFTLWQQTGYGVLVVSAALRGVPGEVKEAARLDGANEEQIRWLVTLPLLRPTFLFLTVIGTVLALQSYTAVFLLTRGGPFGSTRVVGYYLYEMAFERFQMGYGAALTVLVMVLTLLIAFVQFRVLAERQGRSRRGMPS